MARQGLAWLGGVRHGAAGQGRAGQAGQGRAGITPTTGTADDTFVDRRSVKVGMSWVMRTRAISPVWSLTVEAEHDPDVADLVRHLALGGDCRRAHRPWRLPAAARRAVRSIRGGGHQKQLTRLNAWQGKVWHGRSGQGASRCLPRRGTWLGYAWRARARGKAGHGLARHGTARRGRAGNTPTTGEADDTFVDRCSVKVGTSGVMRMRAIFPDRSLTIEAEHDPDVADLFNIKLLAEIVPARASALATTGRSAAGCSVDSRRRSPRAADRAQGVAGQGLARPIRVGRLAAPRGACQGVAHG